MQLFESSLFSSSLFFPPPNSEANRSSHHDEGEVRVGREALRRGVQELGLAARGRPDLVEGFETNQTDGQKCELKMFARFGRAGVPEHRISERSINVRCNFNDVDSAVMPGLTSQQTIRALAAVSGNSSNANADERRSHQKPHQLIEVRHQAARFRRKSAKTFFLS